MRNCLLLFALAIAIPAYAQKSLDVPRNSSDSVAVPVSATERLTLGQAWRIAEQANPQLRAAEASLQAAEGQLTDTQGLLWNNPQLSTNSSRRQAAPVGLPGQRFSEWEIGLAQTFELAGQSGYRREATQLDLSATHENIAEIRRRIRAEVEQRFVRVLALQRRAELESNALKLIEDAAAAVRKRVGAGEDSRLDGNLASVEAERARNQLTQLGEQLIQARADLATFLQLPPHILPEAIGELTAAPPGFTLEALLINAADRPQLRALDLREQAASRKLALERASVYPDVTVGLSTAREAEPDTRFRVVTLSVSVPLPLFRRNATGIGRASTELTQSQIERQAAIRDASAKVRELWQRLDSLRARVQRLTESVLPSLDENQRLSTVSYRAGELGLLQLLIVNRQLLDARRDYLDAVTEFIQTRIALEQAAGITGAKSAP